MNPLIILAIFAGAYLLGAVPFGYLFVRWSTGKDVTEVQSGRTGGTNAMRAAGFGIGLATAAIDLLKAAIGVWIARAILPDAYIVHAAAPLFAILGHNYSIFLIHRDEEGKIKLGGGAGGAATVGGSFGLWAPSFLFIFPLIAVIFYFIGFASVTTLSAAFLSIILFSVRAFMGEPVEYIFFGVIAQLLLIWSLRPNIKRLIEGNERIHGFRARHNKPTESKKAE